MVFPEGWTLLAPVTDTSNPRASVLCKAHLAPQPGEPLADLRLAAQRTLPACFSGAIIDATKLANHITTGAFGKLRFA